MPKHWISIIALVLATLACNWSDIAPPAAPVIEPSPLPTFAISTLTPVPTETPLPTPTSTPDAPIAWPEIWASTVVTGQERNGKSVSSLSAETITEIKGRTINTAWWYVSDPITPGEFCWVAYDVVDTAGNLNIIPIVEPPVASVTDVTVDALVTFTACGGSNEVKFNGSISANGPTMVTYHWDVGGDDAGGHIR